MKKDRFTVDKKMAKTLYDAAALEACHKNRRRAYREESDPLVMEMVRGETDSTLGRVPTTDDIQAAIDEIKKRFPKP